MKTNAMRLLDLAGIKYTEREYDIADGAIDARSIAAKLGEAEEQVFKTLVCRGAERDYLVFVVPAVAELDFKKAARVSGRKAVEMIALKELFPLTGYVHGGCSPVGMKKSFPAWIDESAILYDHICVSGGRVGLNLALCPEDLAGFISAEFGDLSKIVHG